MSTTTRHDNRRILTDGGPSSEGGIAQVRVEDDEIDRVVVHANGIVVDVIANEDGSVYVEAYAYDGTSQQAVVSAAFIDAYKHRSPNIRLRLADRQAS